MFLQNISLKQYNTFGIDAHAKYFAAFQSTDTLQQILKDFAEEHLLILGGGSNLLFTDDFNGAVLKNELTGIEIVKEDEQYVYVKAAAGESWHGFVEYCIQRNIAGVENLSLIPGNCGASPMQNIGAYGVEIKDVFHELTAYHIKEKRFQTFTLNDCEFGYRNSVFKNKYKGEFVILDVTYRLSKEPHFNITYGAITQELEKMNVQELSIGAVSEAVIRIRQSKLPDPKQIGNAGSFFKNPEVSAEIFEQLQSRFEKIPSYKLNEDTVKIPAAWLIEQCGWKGYRSGDAGCHINQPLVLVNYGNATGKEIYKLSEEILISVKERFGIDLEREVNII